MVGISKVSISIVSIKVSSISSGLSISRSLAIVMTNMGIGISVVSVVGISKMMSIVSMVGISKGMSVVSIVSISLSLWLSFSSSLWFSISGPLAIEDTSISIGISLTGNGGKKTQGYNSNGLHH